MKSAVFAERMERLFVQVSKSLTELDNFLLPWQLLLFVPYIPRQVLIKVEQKKSHAVRKVVMNCYLHVFALEKCSNEFDVWKSEMERAFKRSC